MKQDLLKHLVNGIIITEVESKAGLEQARQKRGRSWIVEGMATRRVAEGAGGHAHKEV
jgi:hypothetical protein